MTQKLSKKKTLVLVEANLNMLSEEFYLSIFSKNVRIKIFNEAENTANFYINELNKYKSKISNIFDITDKHKVISTKDLKSNEFGDFGDLLKITWETTVLLNDLETKILSIPFLTTEFDDNLKSKHKNIKHAIMISTYLSTKLLKNFLLNKKHIFLSKKTMPSWKTDNEKNDMEILTFTKNIYEKFECSIRKSMLSELNNWANNNEISRSFKKLDITKKLHECILYFYEFCNFIAIDNDNDNLNANEIYSKFDLKLKEYYLYNQYDK